MGPAPLGGNCEGGKVSTHWEVPSLVETGGEPGWGELRSHGGERSNRGAEGKVERFPHRGSVPTHQPESLVCSPARAGGAWERRRSDPRERTGAGGMNTD